MRAKFTGKPFPAPPRPSEPEPVPVGTLVARSGARLAVGEGSAQSAETGGRQAGAEETVTGATLRAQQVQPGDLFAALPGARAHGADFAAAALAAGAAAVLTDEAGAARSELREAEVPVVIHPDPRGILGDVAAWIYGEPSLSLNVLGVTGTSGKTTVTYLLEAGLRAAGHTTGLIGTVQTLVAGERLTSDFTTPEAPDLQALLAVMAEQGVTHVPMEVSSHALALGRVNGTRFAVGAFTNLSQDHLDFHADMDDYFAAKAMLFDGRSTTEVVCVDGEWGRRLVSPHTITVSTVDGADWTASEVTTSPDGSQSFVLHGPEGFTEHAQLRLPGSFNVANALLAAAGLHAVGVSGKDIVAAMGEVDVPGRMERIGLGQDFTAVVDYAHKPAAVAKGLDAIRARTHGKLIVVLGCGGDRDVAKRPVMGAEAARRSDVLVVTDDNPRSEDPAAIRAEMLRGALDVPAEQRGEVIDVADRRDAIAAAVCRAARGDVVIVAGKGHETGQEVAGVVHPFSDRDELEAVIRARLDSAGESGAADTGGSGASSDGRMRTDGEAGVSR